MPLQTYILMGLLLVLAFGLSNMSLLYLTYPTKVVLKASKLVAVMPLGLVVLNKTYVCTRPNALLPLKRSRRAERAPVL